MSIPPPPPWNWRTAPTGSWASGRHPGGTGVIAQLRTYEAVVAAPRGKSGLKFGTDVPYANLQKIR